MPMRSTIGSASVVSAPPPPATSVSAGGGGAASSASSSPPHPAASTARTSTQATPSMTSSRRLIRSLLLLSCCFRSGKRFDELEHGLIEEVGLFEEGAVRALLEDDEPRVGDALDEGLPGRALEELLVAPEGHKCRHGDLREVVAVVPERLVEEDRARHAGGRGGHLLGHPPHVPGG